MNLQLIRLNPFDVQIEMARIRRQIARHKQTKRAKFIVQWITKEYSSCKNCTKKLIINVKYKDFLFRGPK